MRLWKLKSLGDLEKLGSIILNLIKFSMHNLY